jgi:hypothetical protein
LEELFSNRLQVGRRLREKAQSLTHAQGIVGLAGYVSKGIYEEVQTSRGVDENRDVSEAQMVQGFKEWEDVSEEERRHILLSIKRQLEDLETLEG